VAEAAWRYLMEPILVLMYLMIAISEELRTVEENPQDARLVFVMIVFMTKVINLIIVQTLD
jgi:hypothetical protein